MRIKQALGLVILFIGPFSIPSSSQVVATWIDSSGNWSNSANWSTLTVPNNGGGKTYDVVINGTGADKVTIDAAGTTINSLTLGFGETFQSIGTSSTLTAGFVANNAGTINWRNGSLAIVGLSNMSGGVANIHNTNVTIGSYDYSVGGVLVLTGCSGSIGPGTGFLAGELIIDNSNLTVGGFSFPDSGLVSITSSTVILGGVGSGDRSTVFIGGSSVITGGISNSFGAHLTIDGSSVIAGSLANGAFNSGIGIQNGSAVTVNVVGNNGQFGVDGTSSLTVSGDFENNNSAAGAPAFIDGPFIVTGTLNNADGAVFFIDGPSNIHALQNDGIIGAGGVLIVNGGGFSNQMNGSLTLSGVANVMGGFTNSGGSVVVNPSATLTSDSYSQSGGSTDVSGTLSTASYKQSGGGTIIESGGTISATTFKATGGTVTVNGTLDPTAVEIGSGATLQGAGKIVGNVAMSGTMIPGGPGAPGTVTIFGNYEQTGNGILKEFISSSSNGLLSVNGDVALDSDSILSITLLGGFNPLGDTFTIMDYASLVGQFSNGSSFWDDGFLWDVNYGANQIDISAVRSPEPSSLLLLCIGFAVLVLIAQWKMAKTPLLA